MTASACDFCEIVRGAADAEIVYESPDFMAFFPLNPATLGHTLVIPRPHAPDVWSLPSNLVGPLFETAVSVGAAIRSALSPEGMNIIHSAGGAATQTVFHLHVHLVPRWPNDPIEHFWPDPSESPPKLQQEQALKVIVQELSSQTKDWHLG